MILCDDPAAFPAVLATPVPDGAPVMVNDLWEALVPGRTAHAVKGPEAVAGWETGFLVAAPDHSQFDALRDATATSPLKERVWCLAAAGTGCRGQHGRSWQAVTGNLHLSIGLPASPRITQLGAVLNALPAVVACDALVTLLPDGPAPAIKWVNDLWLAGAKVGGVLTGVRQRTGGGEVFLGLGLNVSVTPFFIVDRFTPRATCLGDHVPQPPGLAEVLSAVLQATTNRWEELDRSGVAPLLAAYRDACAVIGRRVSLWPDTDETPAAPLAAGRVAGIADDLGLVLEGQEEILRSGRLALDET